MNKEILESFKRLEDKIDKLMNNHLFHISQSIEQMQEKLDIYINKVDFIIDKDNTHK